MEISLVKRQTQKIKDFNIEEWKIADKEHYGFSPDWQPLDFTFQAIENGKIVGTLHFEIQLELCTIKELLVAYVKRRNGIGRALLKRAEQFAKDHACHKVYLITGEGWESERFYEAMGYTKSGTMPSHYLKRDFVEYHKFI